MGVAGVLVAVARPHRGTVTRTAPTGVQTGRRTVESGRHGADPRGMEIEQLAAYHVMAMTLNGVRGQIEAVQANPVPAAAPAAQHADVILQLSAAAQTLVASSH
jgi:hypothetical protein